MKAITVAKIWFVVSRSNDLISSYIADVIFVSVSEQVSLNIFQKGFKMCAPIASIAQGSKCNAGFEKEIALEQTEGAVDNGCNNNAFR